MSIAPTRRLLLVAGATLAIACSTDSSVSPGLNLSGTYGLETFNGNVLPFTLADTVGPDIYSLTYTAPFSITLNGDNTMRIVVTGIMAINGDAQTAADTTTGYYSVKGDVVTFLTWQGDSFDAKWNGSDGLTIDLPPDRMVFRKQ